MTKGAFFTFWSTFIARITRPISSEVEHNLKISITYFDDLGSLYLHFDRLSSVRSLSRSSEVERNLKAHISFLFWGGGGGGGYISQHSLARLCQVKSAIKIFPNAGGGGGTSARCH